MTEKEKYKSFACSCREEGKKECAEIKAWAYNYLSTERYPTTDENFLSKFMYKMLLGYYVDFSFHADQWGGISAGNKGLKEEYQEELLKGKGTFSTFIQCDKFEDGLAYTLRAWVDHYGEPDEN